MCGIAGIIRSDNEPVPSAALERACAILRHRGPDDAGWWIAEQGRGRVGLAAVRLAVLDPTPAGHQPMQRGDGRYLLVYNGEVYNHRALRRELSSAGDRFTTDTDTEVVLAACSRWGADALARFNGMWALAFYDTKERMGFIARDRFGIKPLFYTASLTATTFASELAALEPLGPFDRGIDSDALIQHVQFGYIGGCSTIHRGARRLPPGHYLRITDAGISKPQGYVSFSSAGNGCGGDDGDGEAYGTGEAYGSRSARVRRTLAEAVACRRVSDVPIGAFLSGGLDSSIVVSHLAESLGRPVKTFSVGYAGHGRYDETRFARMVAKETGTEHHELVLTQRDVIDAIPGILDHLSEPMGDSSIIPTSLLCKFARQHVTVALSGDGGDELFGGYWRYLGHNALDTYRRIPGFVRRALLEPAARALGASRSTLMGNRLRQWQKLLRAQDHDPLSRHIAWSRILSPDATVVLTDREAVDACDRRTRAVAEELTQGMKNDDPLNRILAFDLHYQLPADMLQKVDLAGMMHGLEVRVPFLDCRVVALAASLPSSFKIDRGCRKRMLTDAYRGRLPDAILDRSKQGFEVPIGEWLRGPLMPMFRDTVTREAVGSIGSLSFGGIERVYEDHLTRRADHTDVLFALLSLCWWERRSKANPV